jgi:uncharacterized protein
LEQRGHRVRGKAFVADRNRIMLPAFGSYTGSVNLLTPAFHGLFDPISTQAWLIGKTALHRFPYKRLS